LIFYENIILHPFSTMQTQITKHLLDKINVLHQSISSDEPISSIERDLMLSYIRQLYDAYVSMPAVIEHVTNTLPPVPVAPVVERVVPPVYIEPVPMYVPPVVEVKPEPIPEPTPEPVYVPEPVVEIPEMPAAIVELSQDMEVEFVPSVVETPKEIEMPSLSIAPPKVVQQTSISTTTQPLIQPTNVRVNDGELFDQNAKKELSDKLGETPIDDIKSSMGINERILTQNELFAGDHFEFENALVRLQAMTNFETEAKPYLLLLAQRYEWANKDKFAKPFIKLVRRKFSK
jgi:hypothetical protein